MFSYLVEIDVEIVKLKYKLFIIYKAQLVFSSLLGAFVTYFRPFSYSTIFYFLKIFRLSELGRPSNLFHYGGCCPGHLNLKCILIPID